MIDTLRLRIQAGSGGNGCVSFQREKYRPRSGPNGGDGGDGGSVSIVGNPSLNTLQHLKFNTTIRAERGVHGEGKNRRGANSPATVIEVPTGTVVWRLLADGSRELLVDLLDVVPKVVARGGRGGWGNAHYVSPTNQEPMLAQRGEPGEGVDLFLELKLLADVGLLAKPNAGKSTLLSRCSGARPRIADYPFTTVEPVLGVVTTRDKSFVMMEVPGLIQGAHLGSGLGQDFLRHAERTRLYLHVIDGLSEDPAGDYQMINGELRMFNQALAEKPQIVVVNKVDVTEVRQRRDTIEKCLRAATQQAVGGSPDRPTGSATEDNPIYFISAATGEGVDALLGKTIELLGAMQWGIRQPGPLAAEENARGRRASLSHGGEPGSKRRRASVPPPTVAREGNTYVVRSVEIERLAALADLRDYRVLLQLWREMERRGIARQLEAVGIQPGDTLRIGAVEVEWF